MAKIVGTPFNDDLKGVNGEPNLIFGDTDGTADPATQLGNDILRGGNNSPDNTIYGDAQDLMGAGTTGGDDTLIGGADSTNTLVGDANSNLGAPTGGNDTLIGGKGGTNTLVGDFIDVTAGADGGNDRLVSADKTTDYMWGDWQTESGGTHTGGADTFVFDKSNGEDFIYDFAQGQDIIELDLGKKLSFSDLNIEVVGSDSVIHLSADDSVTVAGVTALTADDFLFV